MYKLSRHASCTSRIHARTYNYTEAAAASAEVPYGSFDVVISSSKEDEALAQFIKGATPYMYLICVYCILFVARQSLPWCAPCSLTGSQCGADRSICIVDAPLYSCKVVGP